jgi:hypothetical protein
MVIMQWFKKYFYVLNIKNVIYLLIIGLLPFLLYKGCSNKNDFGTSVKKPVLKPTVQKKDKNGTVYTEVKGTLFTEEQMKHITDSMAKALGKGKVQQIIETVTVIDTEYEVKKFYIDSTTGNIYAQDSNKDSKISFAGNSKTGTGKFRLSLTPDTASYITTIKKHLFRASEINVNIYHTNHLFTPSMGSAYTSKSPKTIACIGPVIGVGYNGTLFPFLGVGITLNVVSIKIKK